MGLAVIDGPEVDACAAAIAADKAANPNKSGLIPVEFYCVVELDPAEEKTAGGIILPTQTQEADRLATQEGTLVAVSPHAFTYAEWRADMRKPAIGERVLFKKFAGTSGGVHKRTIDGVERQWRLINDKDILAIMEAE